jgi:dolichyl-phosphate-mannose--protein O-mannosyl transferase
VILLGFISQYLPWSHISRVIFLYHMFGGLIFMVLALAFVLAQIAERLPKTGRRLVAAHLAIAVTFFLYFYPIWTALPISNSALFSSDGTPIWGPKIWLVHCPPNPAAPAHPDLWCWE